MTKILDNVLHLWLKIPQLFRGWYSSMLMCNGKRAKGKVYFGGLVRKR